MRAEAPGSTAERSLGSPTVEPAPAGASRRPLGRSIVPWDEEATFGGPDVPGDSEGPQWIDVPLRVPAGHWAQLACEELCQSPAADAALGVLSPEQFAELLEALRGFVVDHIARLAWRSFPSERALNEAIEAPVRAALLEIEQDAAAWLGRHRNAGRRTRGRHR